MSKYHSAVMACLDNDLGQITKALMGSYERPKISQKGIMITRFVKGINSFNMTDVKGDCLGVTGYTVDEFRGKDMMKLLKLNYEQISKMIDMLETVGYCAKITTFTRKDGYKLDVLSIIRKIGENTYEEVTVPNSSVIRL